ncbi:MAG TPA: hypothetical protein VHO03_15900 [Ignavibacteriales bacterium]|nr:hypothetical protein [Ignavibacteriales bacterium]
MLAVILIILVNLAGILLKFYGLEPYIILLGFRFHISLLIPCILFFRRSAFDVIKKSLSAFSVGKFFSALLVAILPPLILLGGLYLVNAAELSDPEYFYELGLSSIVDYPVYLLWNVPQILILGLFLKLIVTGKKYKFPLILLTLISLFAFEMVPLGKETFNVFILLEFLSAVVLFSVFFSWINNVYYMAVYTFTVIWSQVLLFGTTAKALVNMLLAKNYDGWDGFFTVTVKNLSHYTFILQCGISLILLLFMVMINLKHKKIQAAEVNHMGAVNK